MVCFTIRKIAVHRGAASSILYGNAGVAVYAESAILVRARRGFAWHAVVMLPPAVPGKVKANGDGLMIACRPSKGGVRIGKRGNDCGYRAEIARDPGTSGLTGSRPTDCGGQKVSDPELRRRIRAQAEKVRQEILEKHGVVEWAVDMIRDARGL